MKISVENLARQLASIGGVTAVETAPENLARYAIEDRSAALLFAPHDRDELAAALRICYEAEAAVIPRGAGTAMALGNLPRHADVVIALHGLNRLVEHDNANLTASVAAGMSLATLQKLTRRQNQFAPFDPPQSQHATIGGIVAANLNGPRRLFYGSVRDLVIGMNVALPSGERIKAGGKVVKNVAGYDMCKLFVGSLGTLGIVTEVTLRLAPVPERSTTLIAGGTLSRALRLCGDIWRSPLLPAALVILNAGAGSHPVRHEWAVAVWTEGFAESVARHLRELEEMALRNGLGAETLEGEAHHRFWSQTCDFSLMRDRLVYRLTWPRASLRQLESVWQKLKELGEAPGLLADANAGTVWLSFSAQLSAAAGFAAINSLARDCAGHAMLFAAPAKLKAGVDDVWGLLPPAFPLMLRVKQEFDPKGLFNPGRFLGGM